MDERRTYVIEKEITARDEATRACAAVLEVLRPSLRFGIVDAYSDYRDQLPPDIAEAERWLRQRGSDRRSGDPGMAVEVPVPDDGWEVLCRYAPWSIHVDLLVDGAGEDDLVGRRIAIGTVVLDVTKRIDRCVMVTRPQPGGIERDLSVLRTVLRESDGFLGVGALVVNAGEVQVGDEVTDLDGRHL